MNNEVRTGYEFNVRHEGDHYTAYVDGEFFCSGDTYMEVVRELEKTYSV